MNQAQLFSVTRSLLKIAGAALAAHGMSDAADMVNAEATIGGVAMLVGVLWSHKRHSDEPQAK